MPQLINPAKARLSQGELAIGMGVRGLRTVEVARVMKTAGYDFRLPGASGRRCFR